MHLNSHKKDGKDVRKRKVLRSDAFVLQLFIVCLCFAVSVAADAAICWIWSGVLGHCHGIQSKA
jgi:hypothetical protein